MNTDLHLFRCPRCHEALETRHYEVYGDDISSGALVCPGCDAATPVLHGFCLFTETFATARGKESLQELGRSLFGTRADYGRFIAQQAQRPVYDAYAAYTPFNEALIAFLRFRDLVAAVLEPGDIILDLNNRTGWTGEFLAAIFPEQQVFSTWYGNMGILGYRGFGYWLGDNRRSGNLDCLFMDDMEEIPIESGSVKLVFGYDYLHHHAETAELEELLRITHPGGIVYFSHVHTSDAEPDLWFERGGTLHTSAQWCEILGGLNGLGARYPVLLGELACYRDESVTVEQGVSSDDYNFAAIIAPRDWKGVEVPRPEKPIPPGESHVLQNPLLEADLVTGRVRIRAENMAGGAGYVMDRHPGMVRELEQNISEVLTELQRQLLYWAGKGLAWGEIRQKLAAPAEEAESAIRDLADRQLVLALPVSHAMLQLQMFLLSASRGSTRPESEIPHDVAGHGRALRRCGGFDRQ